MNEGGCHSGWTLRLRCWHAHSSKPAMPRGILVNGTWAASAMWPRRRRLPITASTRRSLTSRAWAPSCCRLPCGPGRTRTSPAVFGGMQNDWARACVGCSARGSLKVLLMKRFRLFKRRRRRRSRFTSTSGLMTYTAHFGRRSISGPMVNAGFTIRYYRRWIDNLANYSTSSATILI